MAFRIVRTAVPALLVTSALGLGASCSSGAVDYPPILSGAGGGTASTSSSAGTGGTGTGGTVTTSTSTTSSGGTTDGGACMGGHTCTTVSECPAQSTLCQINVCTGGCCGTTDAAVNTTCTDDGGKYCDGQGACKACVSATQCPASTTTCATATCTANACTSTFAAKGMACADSGGTLCNGSGTCVAISCADGVQNGNETDVDCGGGTCAPCPDGDTCKVGTDCTDKVCSAATSTCQTPTCADGVQNGNETDVDCGGTGYMGAAACAACANYEKCAKNSDCASMSCSSNACAPASCSDGVQNGTETDVDCGGASCVACANGKKCGTSGANCLSKVCANGFCQVPTCTDGVQNGAETDIDCGGGMCGPCNPGEKCSVPTDCSGGICATTCQCPAGMLVVPIQGGGIYCIDSVEVTYLAYNSFYSANPTTANQDPWCSWNVGWTPTGAWPYPQANEYEPVRYVNWCQAEAYCKYNGRRLCGQIGGGSSPQANFNDYFKDQWFNACTAQGANCTGTGCYPYGTSFNANLCNGDGSSGPAPYTNLVNCQGGEPGLLNMSGNVAEWEDSCAANSGSGDECAVRGGSYLDSSDNLRCDSDQTTGPLTQPRDYAGNDVGFRCCL